MDRRKFLKNTIGGIGGSILTSSLIDFYLLNVYRGMIHRAFGLPQGGEVEKKFLNVAVYGGMPGWMWNIPLRPNGDSDAFSYGHQTNDPSKACFGRSSSLTRRLRVASPGVTNIREWGIGICPICGPG